MRVTPLQSRIDTLDHRRTRLHELLTGESLSPELQDRLKHTLEEIDRKIIELASTRHEEQESHAYATNA